jgi:hypothetical protein
VLVDGMPGNATYPDADEHLIKVPKYDFFPGRGRRYALILNKSLTISHIIKARTDPIAAVIGGTSCSNQWSKASWLRRTVDIGVKG